MRSHTRVLDARVVVVRRVFSCASSKTRRNASREHSATTNERESFKTSALRRRGGEGGAPVALLLSRKHQPLPADIMGRDRLRTHVPPPPTLLLAPRDGRPDALPKGPAYIIQHEIMRNMRPDVDRPATLRELHHFRPSSVKKLSRGIPSPSPSSIN